MMFWRRKPQPEPQVIPEPMIMGRGFFAEHRPNYTQPWMVYGLHRVATEPTTTEDNPIFCCNSRADAQTLVEALDRITEATIASA